MIESEQIYEKLRNILSPKLVAELPKNELTDKLLRAIFTEKEAKIITSGIKKGLWPTTIRKIRKRAGIPKEELKDILKDMEYKGKVLLYGPFCIVPSYAPGIFEMYFTANRDDPESMKKAGEAHYALIEAGYHVDHMKGKYPFMRVIPTAEPVERVIEVEKSITVKNKVLNYEIIKKYLSGKKLYAVHRCACRTAAELAGKPCKRTHENYCITAGWLAKMTLNEGIGRQVSLEELLEIVKKAEKDGLVHQSVNIKRSSVYICQCCPCCCSVLKPALDLKDKDIVGATNFIPQIDEEKCELCGTCVKMCPMETIREDHDVIVLNFDYCIGCGVCAANCPHDAIKLKKMRNIKPVKGFLGIYRKFRKRRKK